MALISTQCKDAFLEDARDPVVCSSEPATQSLEWNASPDLPDPGINPRPAPCFEKTKQIPKRFVFCGNYDSCLDFAISQFWESFTCEECRNYEVAECGSDEWFADGVRCSQPIEVLEDIEPDLE